MRPAMLRRPPHLARINLVRVRVHRKIRKPRRPRVPGAYRRVLKNHLLTPRRRCFGCGNRETAMPTRSPVVRRWLLVGAIAALCGLIYLQVAAYLPERLQISDASWLRQANPSCALAEVP